MCGIFCSLSKSDHILPGDTILERLQARGPDSTGQVQTIYPESSAVGSRTYLTFCSTVLSLRGSNITTQPFRGDDGRFTLCWNGEAWSIDGQPPSGNDTAAVHRLLSDSLGTDSDPNKHDTCEESASKTSKALSCVAGPYAFVFFDHARGRLFFGRDFLGRRSLLMRVSPNGDLVLSSVPDGNAVNAWSEIDCDGVHYIDLNAGEDQAVFNNSPNSHRRWAGFTGGTMPYNFSHDPDNDACVIPKLLLSRDLLSSRLPLHADSRPVARLEALLRNSLSSRVRNIPIPPAVSNNNEAYGEHGVKLAILFSGGLDCTILARLSHELLPLTEPIDLLNVAFENPRIHKSNGINPESKTVYELCPDRITGRSSHAELQYVCPEREWRFVAIDVPYSETQQHRDTVISLMQPHNTEMDLSIANALYFAARGQGLISNPSDNESVPYTTTARVLLSGLGADELFAGYTRHATAFKRGGYGGLLDELELDVSRLGKRNLGRDDRVMSHWGREVRFPYLDEKLLSWALNAPVTDKCGFGESIITDLNPACDGDGSELDPEKNVLRCLAWKLGMRDVAKEKKRAANPIWRSHRKDELWQDEGYTPSYLTRGGNRNEPADTRYLRDTTYPPSTQPGFSKTAVLREACL